MFGQVAVIKTISMLMSFAAGPPRSPVTAMVTGHRWTLSAVLDPAHAESRGGERYRPDPSPDRQAGKDIGACHGRG